MKFFSYGIFILDGGIGHNRQYAVVAGYKTVSTYWEIVEAVPDETASLTGSIMDITPDELEALDKIEAGYDRIEVTTKSGEKAFMYIATNGGKQK